VILVTHNTVIGQIGDRVVHLRDGQVSDVIANEHPLEAGQIEW
jgi:putative ABC transport system ATP-binding protein